MAALATGAAFADGFLGSWFNGGAKSSGFLGMWGGSDSDASDVARIVVTEAGAGHFRIHLYGRCKPVECDWGEQVGHERSEAPDSGDVKTVSADFTTAYGVKHLTLRTGPGGSLHFIVATDFTDHSGRHDFETSGSLTAMATAENGPAPPVITTPGVPTTGAGLPPSVTAPADTEDCQRINSDDIYVSPGERGWSVNDFDHVILKFGTDKVAAVKASRVMEFYRFDEQCYLARPHPKMITWRTGGQVPREAMPGQDCVAVDIAAVKATGGKVMDGDRVVIDFEGDDATAKRAVSVIQNYKLNRQCFVARPNETMVYWLSQ
jgi:hypothetical protein